jgi:hypothetical protein
MTSMFIKKHPYVVLIGDTDKARVDMLRSVLQDDFRSDLISTNNAYEFSEALKSESLKKEPRLDLVIFSCAMPGPREGNLNARVTWIRSACAYYGDLLAIIVPGSMLPSKPRPRVHALDWATDITPSGVKQILSQFLEIPPAPPDVDLYDATDLLLDRQVRGLCVEGRLVQGKAHLANMIRDLEIPPCRSVRVGRLSQGYSGALVLRVEIDHGDEVSHYVIKITKTSDQWKLKREIEHWPIAWKTLDPHKLMPRTPELILPKLGMLKEHGLVGSGNSCAVCYRFLGGPAGRFFDLETVYLGFDPNGLVASGPATSVDPAVKLIGDLLVILRNAWYARVRTKRSPLWLADDAEYGELRVFPPYQLTAWEKAFTLGSLEKLARLGRRLLGEQEWVVSAGKIERWLRGDHPHFDHLGLSLPVTISHVHGDLNANNILIWEDHQRPFLIDFACFQQDGHAMQDFARLEAEIKFALMDREDAVEDLAFDHSSHRLPIWCLMERDLASAHWAKATMPLGGRERFVARALRLIQSIRQEARKTWAQGPGGGPPETNGFLTEYGASLLHHTLRAIGYETLSPFKRLLAVFSAAQWIDLIGSHPRDDESV